MTMPCISHLHLRGPIGSIYLFIADSTMIARVGASIRGWFLKVVLDHYMHIRATEPETAHRGSPWLVALYFPVL